MRNQEWIVFNYRGKNRNQILHLVTMVMITIIMNNITKEINKRMSIN